MRGKFSVFTTPSRIGASRLLKVNCSTQSDYSCTACEICAYDLVLLFCSHSNYDSQCSQTSDVHEEVLGQDTDETEIL